LIDIGIHRRYLDKMLDDGLLAKTGHAAVKRISPQLRK